MGPVIGEIHVAAGGLSTRGANNHNVPLKMVSSLVSVSESSTVRYHVEIILFFYILILFHFLLKVDFLFNVLSFVRVGDNRS
jgi:hypothetical protein